MSDRLLRLDAVTKDYGQGFGVRDLSLEVTAGELVMLVGHNGSGKSTMLELCAGLLEPTDGEITVAGKPAESIAARKARSYIPDNPVLYDDLTVWEHIAYIAGLHGTRRWEEAGERLLETFRLTDRGDDLPARFSRGMRQKVSIVVGLVRPFSLLLVDEPFLGLDAPAQEVLVGLLRAEADRGAAVVVSTHQLDLVPAATRCVGLLDGELGYDGPPDEDLIGRFVHG
jgi:ABC-2 type transport system ATP-binding protein